MVMEELIVKKRELFLEMIQILIKDLMMSMLMVVEMLTEQNMMLLAKMAQMAHHLYHLNKLMQMVMA
jgi:hypothetical protein